MNSGFDIADLIIFGNSNEASMITSNIYLGNKNCSRNKDHLLSLGITDVIRVGYGLADHYKDLFNYLCINICDNSDENIYLYFQTAFEFIENSISNGGKVYVHCRAGISRSASIVCSYLIKKNNWTYEESIKFMINVRKIVCPNIGFKEQLKEWYIKNVFKSRCHKNNRKVKNYCLSSSISKNNNTCKYANLKRVGKKKAKSIKILPDKPSIIEKNYDYIVINMYKLLDKAVENVNSNSAEEKVNKIKTIMKNTKLTVLENFPSKKKLSKIKTKERIDKLCNAFKNIAKKYVKQIYDNKI